MQEGACADEKGDLVAARRDIEAIQRFHGRFRLAFGGAKGGEIMLADEGLRPRLHGG